MATQTLPLPARAWLSRTAVRRWAWFTLAVLIVVVLEGAVVRATSSGGGCGNHWPLCNGEVFPHHPRVATVIEFTHRSLTGFSSVCVLLSVIATFLVTPPQHRARRASVFMGLFLIGEALLGAVLVKFGLVENNTSTLRVVMQSVHFTNTLLLLAATTLVAVWLGPVFDDGTPTPALRRATWTALAAVVLTGATGSLAALADTVFPSPDLRTALAADFAQHSPLLIRMRWMHPAAAALATVAALLMVRQLQRIGHARGARFLAWNIAAQIAIGILDVVFLAPISLQVLHLLSADMFWVALVATSARILPWVIHDVADSSGFPGQHVSGASVSP
ncbi:COX15/CtaA family protein [Terriglobus sp.]|uniref:COX15/CtaA family protein n=1 Tax=Terriglobus sp. TaxID=1889013 RepID=UPI003B008E1B